jgi:hypothetical protein
MNKLSRDMTTLLVYWLVGIGIAWEIAVFLPRILGSM